MLGGLGAFFAKLGTGAAGLAKKGFNGLANGGEEDEGMLGTPPFVPKGVGEEIGRTQGGTLPIPTRDGVPDIDPLRQPLALPEARTVATAPMAPATAMTPAMAYTPPKLALPSRVGPIETEPAMANPSITERPVMRRTAKDGVGAEWRTRMDEMRNGTPQEIVFRDPYGQDRYDYATQGGTEDPTKRSWKQVLKNMAAGAMAGGKSGGLGGLIGGAISGGVGGAIDPAAGREMQFDTWQLPQIEQREDRAYKRQTEVAKLGEILSRTGENQSQEAAHRAGIYRDNAKAIQEASNQNRRTTAYEGLTKAQAEKAAMDTAKTHQELLTAIKTAPYQVAQQIADVRLKTLDTQKKALENQIAQATASSEIAQASAKLNQIKAQINQIQAQTEYTRQQAQGQWQNNTAVTQDDVDNLIREQGWLKLTPELETDDEKTKKAKQDANAKATAEAEAKARSYYRSQGLTIKPLR